MTTFFIAIQIIYEIVVYPIVKKCAKAYKKSEETEVKDKSAPVQDPD